MKICLCGSTRFKKEYLFWNALLTASGHVVYSVSMWSHGDRIDPSPELKQRLDMVHLAKISNSDAIFVIDQSYEDFVNYGPNVYIGESTRREIEYASMMEKGVYRVSESGGGFYNQCEYAREILKAMGMDEELDKCESDTPR